MKVLITGATGFIGKELVAALLNRGDEVRVLSRNPGKALNSLRRDLTARGIPISRIENSFKAFAWNPEMEVAPVAAFDAVDGVVHLAGESLAGGRWDAERKRKILDSRKLGTRNLATTIRSLTKKPVLISTSAVGFYGDRGDEVLTENSQSGSGFLAEVCQVWEEEARKAEALRLVIFRLGVVLGEGGGALEKMLPAFRAGIGGRLGSGRQWMSWIHRDDIVALILRALGDETMSGVYNAVAPEQVQNSVFTREFASLIHRPAVLPAPAFALKLVFGEMAEATLLVSQRAEPARLLREGYSFRFPRLHPALAATLEPIHKA